MRRFLAFMLGLIFGIVFLLGAVGLALYASVAVVHPNEIYPDIEKYLGNLGNVSLLQAYYDILALYNEQTGELATDKLYSVGDFLEQQNISSKNPETDEVMAFGIILPKDLLDAPLFEYFNNNVDPETGLNGLQRALKQIKLSSVPAIVNTFVTSPEGNKPVDEEVIKELENHTMYNLIYGYGDKPEQGEETAQVGIVANLSRVFEKITLASLIPALREENADGTDNTIGKLLYAVGQAPIGGIIADLTENKPIFGMLSADGSLSTVGQLTFLEILGNSDPLISTLLGELCVADFVGANGDLAVMQALNNISLAGLLGMIRCKADVTIADNTPEENADENIQHFTQKDELDNEVYLYSVGFKDGKYYISADELDDGVATTWYEAQFVCAQEEHAHTTCEMTESWSCGDIEHDHAENGCVKSAIWNCNKTEHQHGAFCYDYLWYKKCEIETHTHSTENGCEQTESGWSCGKQEHSHNDEREITVGENTAYYYPILKSSIWYTVAQLKIGSLFDETGAFNLGNVIAQLDQHKLSDIVNELMANNEMMSKLSALLGFDKLTLSQLLGEGGIQSVIDSLMSKPIVEVLTTLGMEEMDGIADIVGNMSINDLIADGFDDIQLATILKLTKRPVEVVTVANPLALELSVDEGEQPNYAYVVSLQIDGADGYAMSCDYNPNADTTAEDYVEPTWYEVYVDCSKENHTNFTEHTAECFLYQFYQICASEEVDHDHKTDDWHTTATDDNNAENVIGYVKTNELYNILGNVTVGNLMNGGFNSILDKLTTMKLGDLFTTLGMQPLQGALESLNDLTIQELTQGGYETISLGSLLGYERRPYTTAIQESYVTTIFDKTDSEKVAGYVAKIADDVALSTDNEEWFYGKVVCDNEEHNHNTSGCEQTEDGYSCGKTYHQHHWNCYEYLWYSKCALEQHNHENCQQVDGIWNCGLEQHDHEIDDEFTKTVTDESGNEVVTGYNIASGIFGALADLTIGDITTNPDELMDKIFDIKLGDLLDGKMEGLMATLANYTINDLMKEETINNIALADILNYKRKPVDASTWENVFADNDTLTQNGDNFALSVSVDGSITWYEAQLNCKSTHHVESCPENCDDAHSHIAECYGFVWYKECMVTEHSHSASCYDTESNLICSQPVHSHENDDWWTEDKNYSPVDGLYSILADMSIGDITGGADIMATLTNRLTLGDIFGENVPEMLQSLKDTPIANLSKDIETMLVGDLLNYTKVDNGDGSHNWVDENSNQVKGIASVLADETISNLKDFNTILEKIKLGDVLDPVPDMLSSLTDVPVTQLGNKIETLKLGNFLSYVRKEMTEQVANAENANSWTDVIEGIKQNGNTIVKWEKETVGGTENIKWFEAQFTCKSAHHTESCADDCQTAHPHTADCYGYVWYQCANAEDHTHIEIDNADTCYTTVVGGLTAKLSDKGLNDLKDFNSILDQLTLGEVMDNLPTMLDKLKDTPITELGTALNSLVVGDFLGYVKGEEIEEYDCGKEEHVCNESCDGYCQLAHSHVTSQCKKLYNWYKPICGVEEHTHSDKCQSPCDLKEHTHVAIGEVDSCYELVTGITAKLAGRTIDELSSLDNVIATLTLADVFDGEENVPSIFKSIANTKIGNLEKAINDIYVGEFLGYVKSDKILVCNENHSHTNDCYNRKLVCKDSEHTHDDDCYMFLYDWFVLDCADTTHNEHSLNETPDCYKAVTGITAKLANEKIKTLGDIGATIQTYTLADVFGGVEKVPSMLRSIANTEIGKLQQAIDELYVGEFLSYAQKDVTAEITLTPSAWTINDGWASKTVDDVTYYAKSVVKDNVTTWHEATICCKDDQDAHTTHNLASCYGFVWYEVICQNTQAEHTHAFADGCYKLVEGVTGKLANEKIKDLGKLSSTIQSYTLYDVLGENVPSVLKSIQDKPISSLGESVNSIPVADFLGYVKLEGYSGWYQECDKENCSQHTAHVTTNGKTYGEVTGITAKLANKTVGTLGDVSNDIQDMTLGEILVKKEDDSPLLKSLYDTKVGDIGSEMNNIYLGTAMGYVRDKVNYSGGLLSSSALMAWAHTAENSYLLTENYDATNIGSETWYKAKLTCEEMHTHTADCFEFAWYEKCSASCGHSDDQHQHLVSDNTNFYTEVGAPNVAFVNSKLNNVGATMDNLTLGELVDCTTSPILNALSSCKVTEIGSEINNVYVGTSMGYVNKIVDVSTTGWGNTAFTDEQGNVLIKEKDNATEFARLVKGKWYEATACSNTETHTHSADCFKLVWYAPCELTDHTHTATCSTTCDKSHTHTDSCCDTPAHNHVGAGEVLGSALGAGETDKYYSIVFGINAKIAHLTISEMQGNAILTIMQDLTMGDMVDSKIMNFTEEEEHKLAIIYCGGTKHSATFELTIPNPSTMNNNWDLQCNLYGFLQFSSYGVQLTDDDGKKIFGSDKAKEFFHRCHGDNNGDGIVDIYDTDNDGIIDTNFDANGDGIVDNPTSENETANVLYYEKLWKQEKFNDFIRKLLDSMSV